MTSRIFITGGTGLFGKWLLDFFQPLETELVVLTRDPDQFLSNFPRFGKSQNLTFVQGDVRNFTFPSGSFDYVIHAATEVVSADSDELESVIIDGTHRVLEFSKQANIKRLLYVSSGAVYGIQPPNLPNIPETFPCNPTTAYGKAKLQAENLCLESDIKTVIARGFAFVGPDIALDKHFAIGNFIGNCLRNKPIEIKGDGTPLRSYMYGSDLAEWLVTILQKGRSGEAYNVGSPDAISIEDLANTVRRVLNSDSAIRICEVPNLGKPAARYIPDIQKAKKELGLSVRVDLETAIAKTARTASRIKCRVK